MKSKTKQVVITIVVVGLVAAIAGWYLNKSNKNTVPFRTAGIKRGELVATISATGTIEPEEVINVGAQVAGKINSFGKDRDGRTIDYRSAIEEGTVLAQIDDSLYTADTAQATAQLQMATASVQRADADLKQLQAKLYQAQRDWARAEKLGPSEALSQSSYDSYKSAYEIAQANVAVGQAAIIQAQASITQAQAILQRAQRNLSYCTIIAPVSGVIIDRRVNIGQTVVASLNAPSLFLIAKDLKRMQIWVAVNEADIGNIHPGQAVSFTIDAYPGEIFRGEVVLVRLNAAMTQNVVTYTVEVSTDNSNEKLLPYLTANVQFELDRISNVLLVPNIALRWSPQPNMIAPEYREALTGSTSGNKNPQANNQQPPAQASAATPPVVPAADKTLAPAEKRSEGIVWVQQGKFVCPIKVRIGLSDGSMTQVEGDEIKEGLDVIIGQQLSAGGPSDTTNPFTPQMIRRTR